jgi:hypothetical protein
MKAEGGKQGGRKPSPLFLRPTSLDRGGEGREGEGGKEGEKEEEEEGEGEEEREKPVLFQEAARPLPSPTRLRILW